VGLFNPITIGMLLVSLAMAYHIIRNGKSPMWLVALALASFAGFYSFLATIAVWFAYLIFGVFPDLLRSRSARRLGGFQAGIGRGMYPHGPLRRCHRAL